jgi:hypothetical protein
MNGVQLAVLTGMWIARKAEFLAVVHSAPMASVEGKFASGTTSCATCIRIAPMEKMNWNNCTDAVSLAKEQRQINIYES